MHETSLQQHKDVAMMCEKGIPKAEGYNQLITPKPMTTTMTTSNIGDVKINLFCTNYECTNHTTLTNIMVRKKKQL
jgi:hypothetical protein